jgi:hypothetical protein
MPLPGSPGMVTIMIRVPARIHKAMLRIKRDEGVSMQTQVMVLLKAVHDADGKAART